MPSLYNRVAGQGVERVAALSDGMFAVAMTLLVLDLRVPARDAVHSEHDLWRVLVALSPRLLIFLMSVMTLGIFWVGQQTQLNHFARAGPQPRLDSHRVPVLCLSGSLFHCAFGRVHSLSDSAADLLVQCFAARTHTLLELELRNPGQPSLSRHPRRNSSRRCPPHRHRAIALCLRRRALLSQHVLQHRRHRNGASELCRRASVLLGIILAGIRGSRLKTGALAPSMDGWMGCGL